MTQQTAQPQNYNHTDWLKHISALFGEVRAFAKEAGALIKESSKKFFNRAMTEIRFFISKSTMLDYLGGGITAAIGFMATLVFLSGFGLIGYQIFLWLKDGTWTEFPLFVVFNFLFENTALHSWMQNPESWYGLQKVGSWFLENIPLSLALIVPGFTVACAMWAIAIAAICIRYYQFKRVEKESL